MEGMADGSGGRGNGGRRDRSMVEIANSRGFHLNREYIFYRKFICNNVDAIFKHLKRVIEIKFSFVTRLVTDLFF